MPSITIHSKQLINMKLLYIHRQAHRLSLMYKITYSLIDIDSHIYLHNANNQRTRNTHNQKYQTYHPNTDAYKHSYFPLTIHNWNRLPQRILESKTIDSFTKEIHTPVTTTSLHQQLQLNHSSPCTPGAPLFPSANSI